MTGPPTPPSTSSTARLKALSVHVLTAGGIVFAFLAAAEIASPRCDPRWVFLWFAAATLVDAADGPLARRWRIKEVLPALDGSTIDDLVDYLLFTFLPLMLVWRMAWVPAAEDGLPPGGWAGAWVVPGMAASLFGFANANAKDEEGGFFRGFPSYWNIIAFYAGLWAALYSPWINAAVLIVLALLTVTPVRFIYPNLAPKGWKWPLMIGAIIWSLGLLAMLPWYPPYGSGVPVWAVWLSLVYPAVYAAASVYLDVKTRRAAC